MKINIIKYVKLYVMSVRFPPQIGAPKRCRSITGCAGVSPYWPGYRPAKF